MAPYKWVTWVITLLITGREPPCIFMLEGFWQHTQWKVHCSGTPFWECYKAGSSWEMGTWGTWKACWPDVSPKRYQKGNLSKIVAPGKNMFEQTTPKNHWVSSRIVISKGGIHGIWMDVYIMNRDDIIISLSKLGSMKTLHKILSIPVFL